ncbi:LysR family transcriptional regulator [Maritimibacter sp. 55A14]|uniref:LysR family transcriptional regulator n=1 Tax=Maritimibacter sp. 55A14 TaxID=2174844 RepID=UPI000D6050FA|nr:LysR family transcriptional regulator [Maritimibacter sp. 55A14]PWE32009.1 LysR family transcriptional regulator [Maritimibacter sp. 55A14]
MPDIAGRITLWGVEVFVAVAEERSVSAAARRLDASPSAVSQQITNLETAIGARLVDRSGRPMALTGAGELFLRRAQSILNEAAQARAELAMQDLSRLTRLRLGMIEDFDAEVTPRLLGDMAEELKGCHFLLETGASHDLLDKLEARALDVVAAARSGPAPDWVEYWPLLTEPFIAAAPRGWGGGGTGLRKRLLKRPFIHYTARHMMGRLIETHLGRQNITLPHRFELDSYHAIMAMVAAGAGWTIITPLGYMAAHRFRGEVDVFPLPFAPMERTIALHARRDVLGDMPGRIAARMRPLLEARVVGPAVQEMPFLEGQMRVLEG